MATLILTRQHPVVNWCWSHLTASCPQMWFIIAGECPVLQAHHVMNTPQTALRLSRGCDDDHHYHCHSPNITTMTITTTITITEHCPSSSPPINTITVPRSSSSIVSSLLALCTWSIWCHGVRSQLWWVVRAICSSHPLWEHQRCGYCTKK